MKVMSATPVTPYVSNPSALGPTGIARIVARAVGDHSGVPRVVFFDVEDNLHQIRTDVGDLRKDAAGDSKRRRPQRLANRESDEARAGVVARDKEEDAEHQEQLDADEQHPMLMPARNGIA